MRIFVALQKHFFKKDTFYRLEWLKTCFYVFSHTSWPPETFFIRDVFYRLEWLKTCFDAFAHTSRPTETFFQKRYFLPSGVVKTVFWFICAYFQTTRNCYLMKWLKTCFDAFAHTSRPPETVTLWSGQKRVLMHLCILPDHQNHVLKKDIF
jgi:hypothetical protein